jgi:uridine kinase
MVVLAAIDGIDGSGKSRLADQLLAGLRAGGAAAALLHVDDFRRPVDWSRTDKSELDLYYDDYYDLPRLDRALRAIMDGAAWVELPTYDLEGSGQAGPARRIELGGAQVVLVEGVFVQRVPAVAAAATIIYVETTFGEAHRRILARDVARGRAPEEVERRIASRYFPAQRRYGAAIQPQAHAAVLIDNQGPALARPLRFDPDRLPASLARALQGIFELKTDAVIS